MITQNKKQNLSHALLLVLAATISLSGNAYQGMSYVPNGKIIGSLGFMIMLHVFIDLSKFFAFRETLRSYHTNENIRFWSVLIVTIIAAAISMFSTGNLITKNIKESINSDRIKINSMQRTRINLQNKIDAGNNNTYIQNCKWSLSGNNRKNGAATKAFCNKFDAKGNVQSESRPILTEKVNVLGNKLSELKNKTYFPIAQYITEISSIDRMTVINVLVFFTTVIVEFLILTVPYMFTTNYVNQTVTEKPVPARKQKAKDKNIRKKKVAKISKN